MARAFYLACSLLLASLIAPGPAFAQKSPFTPELEQRVDSLLRQMTLEEKVGQLNLYSAGTPTGPGTGRADYGAMVERGQVGGFLNLVGVQKINAMQRIAVEKSRLHIPLLFALDVIHGYRTIFPDPLALSATWNPPLIEKTAWMAAAESLADGIRWDYSPMVDIARDARWGRIVESAGEDPYLGSAIARAYVHGYQGDHWSMDSVAACVKHFAGYGAVEGGRDYNTTEISERTLREIYLPPFHAAADAGVVCFMSAFNALDGVPASADPFTLRQVLRHEWGFKGLVVSDWQSILELENHGIANDGRTAALRAFKGGVDMDMESDLYITQLPGLVRSGAVSGEELDAAVRDVLRVKFALGLFEHPYAEEGHSPMEGPLPEASRALARTAAEQSFVLLKNAPVKGKPILPLPADFSGTVALIGPQADSPKDMLGSNQSQGRPADVVTLRRALTDYSSGKFTLLYASGADISGEDESGFADALAAARRADIVLLALGEQAATMDGEAASRAHLDLPGKQQQLLEAISALGKPTVLILFSGRPLVLTEVEPRVQATLEAWFPGIEAGPALVETLFGRSDPSGKLTATFPRSVGQEPLYYNALSTGRPAGSVDLTRPPRTTEEKYVSRYIDETNAPLYPFGFGLSYTTYSYSLPTLSATATSAVALNSGDAGAAIHVSAEVKNTGQYAGDEIVQLYIRQRGTSVARPVRELKGFQKITLAPGESKTVEFTLSANELAFWNIEMKHVAEPARVDVWVAPDSASGSPVSFEIKP